MRPERGTERFRALGPADAAAVAACAGAAFRDNAFYARALGLTGSQFPVYWRALFELILRDPHAAAFGIECEGTLVAGVAVAYDGFPSAPHGLRFLVRLLWALGLPAWWRYVRFARAYTRAMLRPPAERRVEARGLWLFVRPGASGIGLGSRLVRQAAEVVRATDKALLTGFIDAGNAPLVQFYRRGGFRVLPPFRFAGLDAAVVERRLTPPEIETC